MKWQRTSFAPRSRTSTSFENQSVTTGKYEALYENSIATLAGSSSLHVGQRIAHGGALGATQPGSPKAHLKLRLKLPCSSPRTKPDLAEKKNHCD